MRTASRHDDAGVGMSVNLFCAAYFALAAWFWHDTWMYGPNCFCLGMNVAFLIAIAVVRA